MAERHAVYRMVPKTELEKISDTVHHGGIVAMVEDEPIASVGDAEATRWSASGESLVVIDGVGNPHNLGFLARTAAFLGYRKLVIGARGLETPLNFIASSSYRVAEGAMEELEVRFTPVLHEFIRRNRANFFWLATAVDSTAEPLERLDQRRVQRPPALVFGNEESGVSPEVLRACERRLCIPGTGAVESLNVSSAASIVLYHLVPLRKRMAIG
jgi:TrmH RNA methyltransferase